MVKVSFLHPCKCKALFSSDVLFPYLREKTECDVILRGHDGSVPCHRLLLASLSSMLRSVLSGDTWDETITIMMPDISVQELDTFLGNLYEGSKEVSSTNMELLRLFGLVVSPQQNVNVRKNMMATQTISILKRKRGDDPPIKMKSILKPHNKLVKKERTAKTSKKVKVTSEPEIGVKEESDDAIMEDKKMELDPLSMDNMESDLEDTEAVSLVEIKMDDKEVPSNESETVNSENDEGIEEELDEERKKKEQVMWNFGDQERIESDPIWGHVKNIDCTRFNYSKGFVSCNYCEKRIRFSNASSHIWSLHKILIERPSRFKKPSKQSLDNKTNWTWKYISIDPENEFRVICQLCDKNLSRQSGVEKHLRQKHKLGDQILCSICGKSFRDKNSRNTHELTHTQNFQYYCTVCGKGFYEKWKLTDHLKRTHEEGDEEPSQCTECGKTFKIRKDCNMHMYHCRSKSTKRSIRKTEAQLEMWSKKPYRCGICKKGFNKESYFNLHMKIHTGEVKIECKECGKSFADAYYLKTHIKNVHSNVRPFSCSICSKSFKEKKVLKGHMLTHERKGSLGPTV